MDQNPDNYDSKNRIFETTRNQSMNMDYGELPCLEDGGTTDRSDNGGTNLNIRTPERINYEIYESPTKTQIRRTKKTTTMLQCDECNATFRLPQDLLKHKKLHKGEQLFECHICGRTYTRRDNMKLHMRIHIKERPFSCSQCGETFRYRPNLTRHKHMKHGLPKAYSLSASKTKVSAIDRDVLTGLLPDYNTYSQLGSSAMPQSMASVLNSGQRQQSEKTFNPSTSVDLRYTNAGYHRQDGYTSPVVHQPANYASPGPMPVIGQVYSLNRSQNMESSTAPVTATAITSKSNSDTKTCDGKNQKPQKISTSCPATSQLGTQDSECSGSGGEGTRDGFTIHWKFVKSEQSPESGSMTGAGSSPGNFSRDNQDKKSDDADVHPILSTDSEESGQRSFTQEDHLDDRDESASTAVAKREKDQQHAQKESERKIVSPSRLTIPRIGIKAVNTANRRKQILPLRLSLGRSPLRGGGQKKDGESKSSAERESASETDSGCESCLKLKEFQCQYCEISFPDLSTFMIHRGCHGRESAFQCNACGQCCKDRVEFNAHIITGHFM